VRDDLTERLASHADVWRNVKGLTDGQLADMIRQDQIDILVDLSLHMADNRLLVFARKPAPVQVSWLGYPGTTGLTTIDYRITDAYMDPFDGAQGGQFDGTLDMPRGVNDAFYSERSVRLPEAACFQPVDATPPVGPLPALASGFVTFGCLNNFCKVTNAPIGAWVQVLRAVPNSRLLLHAHEGEHQQRARERLAEAGIDPQRARFVGFAGGGQRYFELFHQIDVCLDPFPYGGGTTTCESLWMGVPVITLAGASGFSRMGLGTLTCIGLPELVTQSEEAYIQAALDMATDLTKLADLRSALREKMRGSPLTDGPRFARNMEAAYREMWQKWCAQST
jgi:protein O-GlcNAc transferase